MTTLAEIESATEALSDAEQRELFLFLIGKLRTRAGPLPAPREFSVEQMTAWIREDEADLMRFNQGS